MKQVIIADPSFNFELLEKLGGSHFIKQSLPLDIRSLNQASALFIRTRVKVNKELLSQAPHLQLIVSGTSGKEHIDEDVCRHRGVRVIFTGSVLSVFVAEYIFLLMLQLSWNQNVAIKTIEQGKWKDHLSKGDGLYGKFLGIIGFGHIGKQIVNKAHAFGMDVGVYHPNISESILHQHKVRSLSFEDLLKKADFVSLNVSYRPGNEKLISFREFALMKPSAYFINTSRGEMVCEKALIQAIREEQIQGAAVDVFNQEPLPKDSPLQGYDRLILTPHYATHNRQALDRLTMESFTQLETFHFSLK